MAQETLNATLAECIGCSVINGQISPPGGIIFDGAYWIVNHCIADPKPLLKGLLIIQPRRHVEHLSDMTSEEMDEFGPLLRKVTAALNKVLHPIKIYACSFGDGVKHVHFLIIPRNDQMPANGAKVLQDVIDDRNWVCQTDEASQLAADVRSILENE